jgi:hypothetical protein
MKTMIVDRGFLTGVMMLCLGILPAAAAPFNSGSNGSYGPMNITSNTTLNLPPDGVFHCTTITVAQGITLRFNANPLNTPVYLLATGDVTIAGIVNIAGGAASGAVPGKGGPGGFDGGFGGFGANPPLNRGGDGHGPGRGVNANGRYDAAHANGIGSNTNAYGNVLIVPLLGGSGGSGRDGNPGSGGGGGGGAILIASNTKLTINGAVHAVGGFGSGAGSGGAIRLVAPDGGGGGNLNVRSDGGAAAGRIRIDTENNLAFRNLSLIGAATRGTRMFVFPPSTPQLHIVEAAGQQIPTGAGPAVSVELPAGSPTSQVVRLRGEGFSGNIPVQLVVVPENSASTVYDLILNGSANPPEITANVLVPVGQPTIIEAWAY